MLPELPETPIHPMQPSRSATFRPDCHTATFVALVVWTLLKLWPTSDGVATPPPSGEVPESPRTNLKVSGKFFLELRDAIELGDKESIFTLTDLIHQGVAQCHSLPSTVNNMVVS